jgi:hypothetical protein
MPAIGDIMANELERVAEILLREAIKLINQIKPQENSEDESIDNNLVANKGKD